MIQTRFQDGRGLAPILRCAQNENYVGGTRFIHIRLAANVGGDGKQFHAESNHAQRNQSRGDPDEARFHEYAKLTL